MERANKRRNPNHIPGIYNYCDRWCERCMVTAKCGLFTPVNDLAPEENDMNNKAFWQKIAGSLSDAMEMLQQKAAEENIDLDNVFTDEEWDAIMQEQESGREKATQHPLIKFAREYAVTVLKFLKQNETRTEQQNKDLEQQVNLGLLSPEKAEQDLTDLNNALEIVQWYLHQIEIKFMRAMPLSPGDETDENFLHDSNGSAKVALIGADRSIVAWQTLLHFFPDEEQTIFQLLATLQKIVALGEKTFPGARSFYREGLDVKFA